MDSELASALWVFRLLRWKKRVIWNLYSSFEINQLTESHAFGHFSIDSMGQIMEDGEVVIFQTIGFQIWPLQVERIEGKIAYLSRSRYGQDQVALPLGNQYFLSHQDAVNHLFESAKNMRQFHLNEANRLDKVIQDLENGET